MSSNISENGTTNQDVGRTTPPKTKDMSDSPSVKVTSSGSRIRKQVPGNNTSMIPLTPEPK